MTRFLLLALTALLLFPNCNKKDDNGSCTGAEVVWRTPSLPGDNNWLWFSDESGEVLDAVEVDSRNRYRLSTDACAETYSLSFLQQYRRPAQVGSQLVEVEVFELTTYIDVPDGLQFDTLITAAPLRAFAVQGVQTLEELLWPMESKELFDRNIFLDPASGLLSFEIPLPEGQPAFLTIRANGEAQTRFIWVDAADEFDYTFNYLELQRLVHMAPSTCPMTGIGNTPYADWGNSAAPYWTIPLHPTWFSLSLAPPCLRLICCVLSSLLPGR